MNITDEIAKRPSQIRVGQEFDHKIIDHQEEAALIEEHRYWRCLLDGYFKRPDKEVLILDDSRNNMAYVHMIRMHSTFLLISYIHTCTDLIETTIPRLVYSSRTKVYMDISAFELP